MGRGHPIVPKHIWSSVTNAATATDPKLPAAGLTALTAGEVDATGVSGVRPEVLAAARGDNSLAILKEGPGVSQVALNFNRGPGRLARRRERRGRGLRPGPGCPGARPRRRCCVTTAGLSATGPRRSPTACGEPIRPWLAEAVYASVSAQRLERRPEWLVVARP